MRIELSTEEKFKTIRMFLERRGLKAEGVLGISGARLKRLCDGTWRPAPEIIRQLVEATEGYISYEDFVVRKVVNPFDLGEQQDVHNATLRVVSTRGRKPTIGRTIIRHPLERKLDELREKAREEGTTLEARFQTSRQAIYNWFVKRRMPKANIAKFLVENSWGLLTLEDLTNTDVGMEKAQERIITAPKSTATYNVTFPQTTVDLNAIF